MKLEQRCRAPQRGRLSRPEHQRSRASSSGHFERPSEAERTRAANVSASAKPSGPEQRFRPPQRSRAGSCGHFERPSEAEGARAAISSAPATPTGLERLCRSPQRLRGGLEQRFRARSLWGQLKNQFRFILGSFWDHFGLICYQFEIHSATSWEDFGSFLLMP